MRRKIQNGLMVSVEGADMEEASQIEFYVRQGPGYVEPYPGPYEATPKVTEQVLATKNKRMAEDVTIYEIPYHETSNQSGGYTAIIGGV